MELTEKEKKAAQAFARLGGLKGGKARAEVLTPEERQEIAREAANARWAKRIDSEENAKILKAIYGSPDRPLRIGEFEIPCYVLEGGKRVVIQRGMVSALGMGRGGTGRAAGGDRLANFVLGKTYCTFYFQGVKRGYPPTNSLQNTVGADCLWL